MIKNNRRGIISCILGVTALVVCLLAAYSQNYLVADRDTPFLSVAVNLILTPVKYIKGLFARDEFYVGPQMDPLGINHVFEGEAIEIFFIIGLFLSCAALFVSYKAVKCSEDSFWYANGMFASITALFLINHYLGGLMALVTLFSVFRVRGNI